MSELVEKAKEIRKIIEKAVANDLNDTDALKYSMLFPYWDPTEDYISNQSKVRDKDTGLLYKCIQSHKAQIGWNPSVTPSLWVRMDEPGEEWPEWRQPVGATDAYEAGYKVSHNGKHWRNIYGDGNVWEPGVYGWEEVYD